MKDIVTPVSPEEVKIVIRKCLENAALVNYTRVSQVARVEGKSICLSFFKFFYAIFTNFKPISPKNEFSCFYKIKKIILEKNLFRLILWTNYTEKIFSLAYLLINSFVFLLNVSFLYIFDSWYFIFIQLLAVRKYFHPTRKIRNLFSFNNNMKIKIIVYFNNNYK